MIGPPYTNFIRVRIYALRRGERRSWWEPLFWEGGSRTWGLVSTNTTCRLLRVDFLGDSPEGLFPGTKNEVTELPYHSKVIWGGTRRLTQRFLVVEPVVTATSSGTIWWSIRPIPASLGLKIHVPLMRGISTLGRGKGRSWWEPPKGGGGGSWTWCLVSNNTRLPWGKRPRVSNTTPKGGGGTTVPHCLNQIP